MSQTTNEETVTIETPEGEFEIGFTCDFLCDSIRTDGNGILYVGDGEDAKAVGEVVVNHGWNKLAETHGGSLLGNVRNTGWNCYESREEWELEEQS